MSTQTKHLISPEEYLASERNAEVRSEFYRGEVTPMVGASRVHNLISACLGSELIQQLKGRPCEVYISDMRVKVSAKIYTYPDVTVACGDIRFEDEQVDTLLNPTVIFEVLSPSTEHEDRGRKWVSYRTIESLREYILVAQDAPRVEHHLRQAEGGWLLTETHQLDDVLELPSIGCRLPLREIYAKVDVQNREQPKS
jgi:Uma2 family endonuclease